MICAKCHLPQLADASDEVAKEIVKAAFTYADSNASDDAREKAVETLEKLSINCLVCHQRNAIIHKWSDGYPQKNAVYGSKDGDHPAPGHTKLKISPVMSESILCGQCHGLGLISSLTTLHNAPHSTEAISGRIGRKAGRRTVRNAT